ncbi:hypothetical protein EVAR_17253_1 [Eumeta japonica]|uniref:Uncharacterized protein n=1 Tax=Eumeta variegata TaxID=151549 RepID=A0A4C1TTI2_EUMVA|nr:hypothetical protein EVAR_17253_1 [Eumeta japonica]
MHMSLVPIGPYNCTGIIFTSAVVFLSSLVKTVARFHYLIVSAGSRWRRGRAVQLRVAHGACTISDKSLFAYTYYELETSVA